MYNPNENLIYTYTMQPGDMAPGQHTIPVPIPFPTLDGNYTFLASAQDNDADNDVVGRQRWALQHNQKGPGLPPIVYIKSDIFHVAWCRAGKPVGLSTQEIAAAGREPHFITRQFQQGIALPSSVTAASNGSLYSYFDNLPPLGGIGVGIKGQWLHTTTYISRPIFSFGMTPQGGGFGYAPMKRVKLRRGTETIIRYTVADVIQQTYPYGFGCVGLLVDQGAPVGYDDFDHQWNTRQLSPTYPEPRTALGWTQAGDFFIVTCNGINNIPSGFAGKTWDEVKTFL